MKGAKIRGLLLVLCLAGWPVFAAAQKAAPAPDLVSTVVTVINHRRGQALPAITRGDVVVRQDGNVRRVVDWQPLRGAKSGVDLAVLIDDSVEERVALQWTGLAHFLGELPADSRVEIAYADYGSATIAQPFTTDRAQALKALRLPLGRINESSSIYLALADLIRHWPADHNRRVALVISDGIDIYYGISQSTPGQNLNLQRAIDAAQKKGVIVDAIFASGAAAYSRNFYLVTNGQSCLGRLAIETGGRSYQVGTETPVNFTPFLNEIAGSLARQYRLTFRAMLGPKARFARLALAVEQNGIELRAPSRVYLPAAH